MTVANKHQSYVRFEFIGLAKSSLQAQKDNKNIKKFYDLIKGQDRPETYGLLVASIMNSVEDELSALRNSKTEAMEVVKTGNVVLLLGKGIGSAQAQAQSARENYSIPVSEIYNEIYEEETENSREHTKSDSYFRMFLSLISACCRFKGLKVMAADLQAILGGRNNSAMTESTSTSSGSTGNVIMDTLSSFATKENLQKVGAFAEGFVENTDLGSSIKDMFGDAGAFQPMVNGAASLLDSEEVKKKMMAATQALANANGIDDLIQNIRQTNIDPKEIINTVVEVTGRNASSSSGEETEVDGYKVVE